MATESETASLLEAPVPNPQPGFQPLPGETPRAFSAFMTWFRLGHARSHQAVADKLGEGLPTVRNWSSKYDWSDRVQTFNAGVLEQQARDLAALHRQRAADWADRLYRFREQEWDAAQKLIAAAQCFLETFGDEDLRKMTLAQVARALKISSAIGRSALAGAELPEPAEPPLSPIQQQFLDAAKRVYSQAAQPPVRRSTSSEGGSPLTPQLFGQPSTCASPTETPKQGNTETPSFPADPLAINHPSAIVSTTADQPLLSHV